MDYNNNYSGYEQPHNNPYAQQNVNQNYQYQQNMQANMYQNNMYQQASQPNIYQNVTFNQYGMRWFLFMVWGYLIYSMINSISSALTMFKVSDGQGIDKMETLSIVTGILYLGIAVLSFYTRKLMLYFSVKTPKYVVMCAAAPLVVTIFMIIGMCVAMDAELKDVIEVVGILLASGGAWKVWLYIIMYVIFIYGNFVYFNNRRHIFNNTAKISLF